MSDRTEDLAKQCIKEAEHLESIASSSGEAKHYRDTAKRLRYLKAKLEQTEHENERLREYAIETTKAITGLTVGGSEFFTGQKLGFFQADIKACVDHIKWRLEQARKLGEARARSTATAEVDNLKAALAPFASMVKDNGYDGTDHRKLTVTGRTSNRTHKNAYLVLQGLPPIGGQPEPGEE